VGRASNRKKAQRRAGSGSRRDPRPSATAQPLFLGLDALVEVARVRVEHERAARRAWWGNAEPAPAEVPPWPENSLGDRLLTDSYLGEAQDAPSLLTAQIPEAAVIAADPVHWNIATSALVRAVVFDGLGPDDPAVSALLGVLAPVAEAELAYAQAAGVCPDCGGRHWHEDDQEFPEEAGPVYLLGGRALMEATWAVVGEDPLREVIDVLRPALAGAVPAVDSQAAADALIAAFATDYQCEQPGDAEELERIGYLGGNALETLVAAGAVPPGDVLRVGLLILSALAQLGLSGSASVLQRTA
jgi:hypothetical protein